MAADTEDVMRRSAYPGIGLIMIILAGGSPGAAPAPERDPAQTPNGEPAPQSLALEEAVRIGLERNPALAAARAEAEGSRSGARAAGAERWPTLRTEAGWHRTDQQVLAFGDKLTAAQFTANDFLLDNLNDPDPANHASAAVALVWPIDASGRIAAGIEVAREGAEASLDRLRLAEIDLLAGIIQAYHGVTFARAAVEVAHSALENARAHEASAAARHEAGTALRSDLLRARVARLERQRDLERRRADLETARARLNQTLGLEPSARVDPLDPLRDPVEDLGGPEEWQERARADHPGIAAAKRLASAARASVRESRAALGPEADATARYERHADGLDGGDGSFFLGIRLRWSAVDPGRGARIDAAEASARAASFVARSIEDRIAVGVRQAFEDARVAEYSLGSAREASRAAEEARRVSAERYAAGLLPLTDLLDVETALVAARLAELRSLHDAVVGRVLLARSAGTLQVPR